MLSPSSVTEMPAMYVLLLLARYGVANEQGKGKRIWQAHVRKVRSVDRPPLGTGSIPDASGMLDDAPQPFDELVVSRRAGVARTGIRRPPRTTRAAAHARRGLLLNAQVVLHMCDAGDGFRQVFRVALLETAVDGAG